MGKNSARMKLSSDVIFRKFSRDDGILINLETKNYYSLNETAIFIVAGIKKGLTQDKILKNLERSFDADKTTLMRGFSKIKSELKKEKMLS